MDPDDRPGLVGEHLHEAVGVPERPGPARGGEREAPGSRRDSGAGGRLPVQSDRDHLGVAEDDHRNAGGVEAGGTVAGGLGGHLGLGGGLVGEGRAVREVADGEDAVGRPSLGVDGDEAPLVDRGAGVCDADRVAVGTTTDDHPDPVRRQDHLPVDVYGGQARCPHSLCHLCRLYLSCL